MIFTGFDSAWGGRRTGALCDLAVASSSSALSVARIVPRVTWDVAVRELGAYASPDHVVAIDQSLVVPNRTGMRPVERRLASALMKRFRCGAHASNTANERCFGPDAGIWELNDALERRGYVHSPSRVAERRRGRYVFEVYPHLAILGLFELDGLVRYKAHHRQLPEWKRILALVGTLEQATPAVSDVRDCFPRDLPQNKANEDALDAFIAAYAAAHLHAHGFERSAIVGDLATGYVVTPVSDALRAALFAEFGADAWNARGVAAAVRPPRAARP